MRTARFLFIPAVVAAAAFLAACGDGPDPVSTVTVAPTATPVPQRPTAIPSPTLPDGFFEAISPKHDSTVTQASTRSPNPSRPGGICFQVNFDGLEKNTLWFRMVLDEKEVTVEKGFTWILPVGSDTTPPEGGTACYAPAEGFPVGVHHVVVAVQNPDNPQEPTRQFMEWQFEVTP